MEPAPLIVPPPPEPLLLPPLELDELLAPAPELLLDVLLLDPHAPSTSEAATASAKAPIERCRKMVSLIFV